MAESIEDEMKVEVKAEEEGTLTEKAMDGFSFAKSEVRGKSAWMQECNIRTSLPSKDQIKVEMVHLNTMRKFSGVFSKEDLDSIGFAPRDPAEVSLEIIRAAFFGDEEIDATAVVTPVKQSKDEGTDYGESFTDSTLTGSQISLFEECSALKIEVTERVRRQQYHYSMVITEDEMEPGKKNELCIKQLRSDMQRLREESKKKDEQIAMLIEEVRGLKTIRPMYCKLEATRVSDGFAQWYRVDDPVASKDLFTLERGGCELKATETGIYQIIGHYVNCGPGHERLSLDDTRIMYAYQNCSTFSFKPISWTGVIGKGQVLRFKVKKIGFDECQNCLCIRKLSPL